MYITLPQVLQGYKDSLEHLSNDELIAKILNSCYSPDRGPEIRLRLLNSNEQTATIPAFIDKPTYNHSFKKLLRNILANEQIQYGPLHTTTPRPHILEGNKKIPIVISNLTCETADYIIGTSNYTSNRRTDLVLPYQYREDLEEAIANPWDIKNYLPEAPKVLHNQIRSRLQA